MDDIKWLMAQEIPRLRRYARSLAADEDAADDLVQDCLERAIRKQHQWRRHGRIRSWLYSVLYSVFLNGVRRDRKLRRNVSLDRVDGVLAAPSRQEQETDCKSIVGAMQALPEEQRAAIALVALEGLSYDEAAEVLDVPIGTLRSRLFRGRDKLRELYDEPAPFRAHLRRVK